MSSGLLGWILLVSERLLQGDATIRQLSELGFLLPPILFSVGEGEGEKMATV
jgi:hypothetical protein